MEFGEKLQELRKSRGLTQEELAAELYVSRTAVSKWESGRGYPSIDSLKEISGYFSVSIDDLLSGEKLLSLAERENRSNVREICDMLFGVVDLFSLLLVVLPLYPNTIDGYVFSVNLFMYTQTAVFNRITYWTISGLLFALGIVKIILAKAKTEKLSRVATAVSIMVSIFAVLFLALTREAYAVVIAFLMLITKGLLNWELCEKKMQSQYCFFARKNI